MAQVDRWTQRSARLMQRCPAAGVPADTGRREYRADARAARVPARGWPRNSRGQGVKGYRYYDLALISLDNPGDQPGY